MEIYGGGWGMGEINEELLELRKAMGKKKTKLSQKCKL